ncbi:hypothetical protein D6833_09410 [Candidatus Parcubacteria bacterium]|nr:MAG: hypothetical protein D6833_09410 [Candidatus Parcubacteria bacterium]
MFSKTARLFIVLLISIAGMGFSLAALDWFGGDRTAPAHAAPASQIGTASLPAISIIQPQSDEEITVTPVSPFITVTLQVTPSGSTGTGSPLPVSSVWLTIFNLNTMTATLQPVTTSARILAPTTLKYIWHPPLVSNTPFALQGMAVYTNGQIDSSASVVITVGATLHTLTVTTVGNGTVTKTPDKTNYLYGEVVTLTATPAPNWRFEGWRGDGLPGGATFFPTSTLTVTMTADRRLTATFTSPQYVFLPLLLKDYHPLVNGDFSAGLDGWMYGKGAFQGHGSGLLPTAVDGVARLGNPNFQNGRIPVGYGYLAQQFTVQKRYLKITYQMITYDIITNSVSGGGKTYLDTFEVSLVPPSTIADADRDAVLPWLNPSGTIAPTGNLLFLAGQSASKAGNRYDTGRQTVTLDMQNYLGQNVTLYLALWEREYLAPYYDDQGWYNTWVDVDEIQLTNTP